MNKNEKAMFFLGQIKARIEEINRYAGFNGSNRMTDILSDLESFFNQGFNELVNAEHEGAQPQTFSGRMELTLWT